MTSYNVTYRQYTVELKSLGADWQATLASDADHLPPLEVKYIVSTSEEAALKVAKKIIDECLDENRGCA